MFNDCREALTASCQSPKTSLSHISIMPIPSPLKRPSLRSPILPRRVVLLMLPSLPRRRLYQKRTLPIHTPKKNPISPSPTNIISSPKKLTCETAAQWDNITQDYCALVGFAPRSYTGSFGPARTSRGRFCALRPPSCAACRARLPGCATAAPRREMCDRAAPLDILCIYLA